VGDQPALRMRLLPGTLAVSRLPGTDPFPAWADGPGVVALTRRGDELSVVCQDRRVPQRVPASRGWRALELEGPIPFEVVGVVARVAAPLAEAGVPLFTIATHDTDLLLVRGTDLTRAVEALRLAGHSVDEAGSAATEPPSAEIPRPVPALAREVLRAVAALVILLGIIHLAATGHFAHWLGRVLPERAHSLATGPAMLNFVLAGVLLLPLGYATWVAAAEQHFRQAWARRLLLVNALAILSMPVLITATMGRPEFYRSTFFLSGVATVGLIGVLGFVAAIALFRGGTTPSSER
jgi:uncharacterized protein